MSGSPATREEESRAMNIDCTFVRPDESNFSVPMAALPEPGDVIEHTEIFENRNEAHFYVVGTHPWQWRTRGWHEAAAFYENKLPRMQCVFIPVREVATDEAFRILEPSR